MNTKVLWQTVCALPLMGLLACPSCKNADGVADGWLTYDWGNYSWSVNGLQPLARVDASLTRLVSGDQRKLEVVLRLEAGSQCSQYTETVDEGSNVVRERDDSDWVIVQPKSSGRPCSESQNPSHGISGEEWQSLMRGYNQDLYAQGDYVLTRAEAVAHPEIPVAADMGTRTILIRGADANGYATGALAAVVDVQKKQFSGIAIRAGWLKDRRSEASFLRKDDYPNHRMVTVVADEMDREFKRRQCRLYASYVRPLQIQRDLDLRQKKMTSKEFGEQLIAEAFSRLDVPTSECP